MALKRLTTGEMISLTTSWTTKNSPDRKALAAIKEVEPLVPQIDASHRGLLQTQAAAPSARLAEIQEQEKTIDVRHDDLLRGCFHLLQALAYLTQDPARAKALLALQKTLLPEGLLATQKTYREEAGQAKLLKTRLGAGDIELLKEIPTLDGTLWDATNEWTTLAAKLGKLEDERAALGGPQGAAPSDAVAARNRWIRAVSAVRTVLELVGTEDEKVQALLSRIDEAERKADRRGAGEGEKKDPKDTPEPSKDG
ncbi:Hypothetical protein A7982_11631 [Minicystis rosea]|nr:Hypothetical protein A7982_11631 [Minicystis rosea]